MARRLARTFADVIDNPVLLGGVKSITVKYAKVGPGQAGARFVCKYCRFS